MTSTTQCQHCAMWAESTQTKSGSHSRLTLAMGMGTLIQHHYWSMQANSATLSTCLYLRCWQQENAITLHTYCAVVILGMCCSYTGHFPPHYYCDPGSVLNLCELQTENSSQPFMAENSGTFNFSGNSKLVVYEATAKPKDNKQHHGQGGQSARQKQHLRHPPLTALFLLTAG